MAKRKTWSAVGIGLVSLATAFELVAQPPPRQPAKPPEDEAEQRELCEQAEVMRQALQRRQGQRGIQVQRQPWGNPVTAGMASAIIDVSPPIDALFKRARDGIERADWKLAIDSLQRIIDDPQGALLERSEGLFESARRSATRQLAELPPEGLRAYRLLFDGVAKGILDRAIAEHDPAGLQVIVDRYIMTRYGPQAGDVLVSWHLDAGRATEALIVFAALELHPDLDPLPTPLLAKWSIALAMAGQTDAARQLVATLDSRRVANGAEVEGPHDGALAQRTTDLTDVIDAIATWRSPGTNPRGAVAASEQWPMLGGAPDRRGWMPAVQPALIGDLPWRVPLPGTSDQTWHGLSVPTAEETPGIPVFYPVVSDGRLFVRGIEGCVAIDMEGFDVLWQAGSASGDAADSPPATSSFVEPARSMSVVESELEDRLFRRFTGGAISVAGDLVLTIEGDGNRLSAASQSIMIGGVGQFRNQRGRWMREDSFGSRFERRRLVARDAATGRLRWERGGQTGDATDPLFDASFRATPLAVERSARLARTDADDVPSTRLAPLNTQLWAPCTIGDDLYLVTLDAGSGEMLDRLLLCSLLNVWPDQNQTLTPAMAGRTMYVPTGHGLLVAVDVDDRSLLWASRYPQMPVDPTAAPDPGAPPVVSGARVLLLPNDSDQVLALDRASGEIRWSTPRRGHSYIIGADDHAAILGGHGVARIAVDDGKYIWSDNYGTPTGRAAISGQTVYLPTTDGLMAIDALSGGRTELGAPDETGSLTGSAGSDGREWLGNLLCVAGALISVDSHQIRKFPDLEQSYPKTLAEHRERPTDARLSERLAWMELFRGAPDRAYAALARVELPAESGEGALGNVADQRRAGRIAHLRVEALFALARRPSTSAEQAIEHIRAAAAAARSAPDLFRTSYRLGELLAQNDQFEEAYDLLVELRTSDLANLVMTCWEADGRMSPVAPRGRTKARSAAGVVRPAREVAGDLLKSVATRLDPQQQRDIVSATRSEVERAAAVLSDPAQAGDLDAGDTAIAVLRRIAAAELGDGVSQSAMLVLGRHEAARSRVERAEYYFTQAARLPGPPASVAQSVAALIDLYLSPQQQLLAPAADLLATLSRRFAGLGAAIAAGPGGGELVSVDEWVTARQTQMNASALSAHRAALAPGPIQLRAEEAWKNRRLAADLHTPRLIHLPSAAPDLVSRPTLLGSSEARRHPALAERVLAYSAPDQIRCYAVADGRELWLAELRLPDDFDPPGEADPAAGALADDDGAYAVSDGQTLIVSTLRGIHAVGIMSGKRLWARPMRGFSDVDRSRLMRTNPPAASDGLVACMLQPRRLSVLRSVDGSMVWERELDNRAVAFVQMFGEFVTTLDPLFQVVHVYRRTDGYETSVLAFRQPRDDDYVAPVVCRTSTGELLFCGPDRGDVVAFDAATGAERWRHRATADGEGVRLGALFRVGAGSLGLGVMNQHIRILEVDTGIPTALIPLPSYRGGPIECVGESNTTVLAWNVSTAGGDRAALAGIDAAAQRLVWERTSLDLLPLTLEQLEQVRGVIPAIRDTGSPGRSGERAIDLLVIDKRTGEVAGPTVPLIPKRPTEQITAVMVWPGVMLLGTTREIFSVATELVN